MYVRDYGFKYVIFNNNSLQKFFIQLDYCHHIIYILVIGRKTAMGELLVI